MHIEGIPIQNYQIIVPENCFSEQILTAKKELEFYIDKYFHKTKDCNPLGYIYIGFKNDFIDERLENISNNDSFIILSRNNQIYITGKGENGNLYGTYYFIEKYLGIDWLTDDCEIKLVTKDVQHIDVVREYQTIMRYAHSTLGFEPKYQARSRLNYTVGETNDRVSYGGIRGLKFAFSWGLFGHTFEVFIPYEEFYVSHPEYFSFAPNHMAENHRYQICLTNPEVLEIVTKRALDYLDKHPDTKIISISQNDAYFDYENNYCLCENCKKIFEKEGSYSGVILQFVNKVAKKIKEKYPNVLVHTFAYHFSEVPPNNVKPDDNVLIQYCNHLPDGFRFVDNHPLAKREKKKLDGWFKISKNMFLWTYLCKFENYFYPIGNFGTIYSNTKYFFKNNVIGIFQQENRHDVSTNFSELRTYLIAKLFNEPEMSYFGYLNYIRRFLKGYYGEGGKYLFKYIQILDKKYRLVDTTHFKNDDFVNFFADKKFIVESKEYFDNAFKATKEPTQFLRLQKAYMQVRFCMLCDLFINIKSKNDIDHYASERRLFLEDAIKYGVKQYREGSYIPNLDTIDYTKSPIVYTKKDKQIFIKENKETEWIYSGDNTISNNEKFGFKFKLLPKKDRLKITIEVKDFSIYCNNENIKDWAQDCVEVYLSEDFNRTNKNGPNDFMFRVNADGKFYSAHEEKIILTRTFKIKSGYVVEIEIRTSIMNNKSKNYGFEIMAHDFDENGYQSTSYWNSFKGSDVSQCPYYYGVITTED